MQLQAYLDVKGETPAAFAKRSGLSRAVVLRVLRGETRDPETIRRVGEATEGAVQPNDVFDNYRFGGGSLSELCHKGVKESSSRDVNSVLGDPGGSISPPKREAAA